MHTRRQKHLYKRRLLIKRLIIALVLIILLLATALVWIRTGSGQNAAIFSVAFIVVAVVIALLQWLFPLPSHITQDTTHQQTDHEQISSPQGSITERATTSHALFPSVPSRQSPFDERLLPLPLRFIGREADLRWLLDRLHREGIAGITALRGMGGIGKTALVAVAVHRFRRENRFPDGIAVVFCQEQGDAFEVMRRILARFDPQHRQPHIETQEELLEATRQVLDGKTVLIVLDNIEPELPIGQIVIPLRVVGATVLLTARHTFPSTVVPAEACRRLDLLPVEDAIDLFAQAFGRTSSQDLSHDEHELVGRIVTALERHTLAVKLAGAYAADCTRDLRVLARELKDPQSAIKVSEGETPQAMLQSFGSSIAALPVHARRLFIALAGFSGTQFGRQAALSLALTLALPDPSHYVDVLVRRALIEASTLQGLPEDGDHERLRLHPLLGALAADMFTQWSEAERNEVYQAIARYYVTSMLTLSEAGIAPDEENIAGVLEWAHLHKKADLVLRLGSGMQTFWYNRGRSTASLRYLPWAILYAEEIASKSQTHEDRLRVADFTLAYAQTLEAIGKTADAETAFKDNLAVRRKLSDRHGEGRVLRHLGKLVRARSSLEEAEDYYKQAVNIIREVGDRKEEVEVLRALGEVAQIRGDLIQTEAYYQQALKMVRELHNQREEGEVLRSLGELVWWRGPSKEAEDYFQQALIIAETEQNRREEGWLLAALGGLALRDGQVIVAKTHFEHALQVDREVQNRREEAWALFCMGRLNQIQGYPDDAIRYFHEAIFINQEVQDRREEARAFCALGTLEICLGQPEEALSFLQKALAIDQDVQNRRGEGRDFCALGQFALACGQFLEAEEHLQRALLIDLEVQDQREQAEVLRFLGELALWKEQFVEAETLFQQALSLEHEMQNKYGECDLLRLLSELALKQGNSKGVRLRLNRALKITRTIQHCYGEGEILRVLGELAMLQKARQRAKSYLQQARTHDQAIQARREEGLVLALQSKQAQQKHRIEESERLYRESLALLQQTQDAFNYARVALNFASFLIEERKKHTEGCQLLSKVALYYTSNHLPQEAGAHDAQQKLGCREGL